MKKIAIILALLLILLSLCSCVKEYHFDYKELKDTVQKIEIIDFNSTTYEECTLIVVSESDQDRLLLDLSQLEYHYYWGDPELASGHCLKLFYKNNEVEIISWSDTSKQGFIKCNREKFYDMIQKYLGNQNI